MKFIQPWDVEVSIAPGFNVADLESEEVSEVGQVVGEITEENVESMEVEARVFKTS